jgi:hypothetical protein
MKEAAALAKNGKKQFPALPQVVKPAADSDRLAFVLADLRDCGCGHCHVRKPFITEHAESEEKIDPEFSAVSSFAAVNS